MKRRSAIRWKPASLSRTILSGVLSVAIVVGPFPMMGTDRASALPRGGKVTKGQATLGYSTAKLLVSQSTSSASFSWSSFNVKSGQSVVYRTPGATSVSLNFIGGTGPATIRGSVHSNGILEFMDANGIVFGQGGAVSAAGVMAFGSKTPWGTPTGPVSNAGTISVAPGGVAALVGTSVTNTGTVTAPGGEIVMAAGSTVTPIFSTGTSSFSVATTGGGAVYDSGVISAQEEGGQSGRIVLKSGMNSGVTTLSSTAVLDASAPNGGNGGTVETSGARVNVDPGAIVTTAAPYGETGTWTLDPQSFYIGMNTGTANSTSGNVLNYEDISATTLDTLLASSNVVIDSTQGGATTGNHLGNIYVDSAVSWSSTNKLTLNAVNNIEVNAALTSSSTGALTLRADDMALGGTATNTTGGGTPSGNGTVAVNSGGSLSVGGVLDIYYNPSAYTTSTPYTNANTSGTTHAFRLLSSAADLEYIDANQATTALLGYDYALNANLNLAGTSSYSWIPLGNSTTVYSGIFNGQGYLVSGYTIGTSGTPYSGANVGFVGVLKSTGIVENLGVSGTIDASNASYVGGIVGCNAGTVEYSYNTGAVVGGLTTSGSTGASVGGIAGSNTGTVEYSYNTGAVTGGAGGTGAAATVTPGNGVTGGGGGSAGGIAGSNAGTLEYSYNTGSVTGGTGGTGGAGSGTGTGGTGGTGGAAGGAVGANSGTSVVGYSYNTGTVAGGIGGNGGNAGGSTGKNGTGGNGGDGGGVAGTNSATVEYAYSTGNVSGGAGGAVGTGSTGGSVGSAGVAGGVVGNNSGTVTNTFYDSHFDSSGIGAGTTSGETATGLSEGTSSGDLGNTGSYTNWTSANSAAFNTWNISSGAFGTASSDPWDMATVDPNGGTTGVTAPILVIDIPTATVTALSGTSVYSGSAATTGTGTVYNMGATAIPSGVTVSSATSSANVGTYAVTPTFSGTSAPTGQTSTVAVAASGEWDITPLPVTATATSASMTYGGTVPSLSGTLTTTGPTGGLLNLSAAWSTTAGSSTNVGSYGITPTFSYTNGAVSGDYTVTSATGNSTALKINPAPLTLTLNSPTKTYNGTTTAFLTTASAGETLTSNNIIENISKNANLSGFVGSQCISFTGTGTYSGGSVSTGLAPNVGTGYTVSLSGIPSTAYTAASGTSLSNYTLPTSATSVNTGAITPAPLTLTPVSGGIVKNYDGSSTAYMTSSSGGISDPTGVPSGGTPQTVVKNMTVTGFATGEGATLNVTNGSYSSSGSLVSNVGSSYSVSASISQVSFSLSGLTSMSNYKIGTTQLVSGHCVVITEPGSINPAPLTVTISSPPSKIYDGTDLATLGSASMSFTGVVSGQGISLGTPANAYYTLSSTSATTVANVGSGYGVTGSVLYTDLSPSGGAVLSNYSIAGVQLAPTSGPFTVSASGGAITPVTLAATANTASMTYGGSAPALSGALSSSTITSLTSPTLSSLVTASWTTSATATSNVGSYAITPVLSYGTNANNTPVVAGDFTLSPSSGNATALSVTPAPLTVSLSSVNKTYDGSSNAYAVGSNTLETVNGLSQNVSPNVTLSGFVNGNSATFDSATGSYLSGGNPAVNVGSGYSVSIPVQASSFSAVSGTLLSNYSVNGVQLTGANSATVLGTGSISSTPLSLASSATKTFDGSAGIVLNSSNTTFSGMPSGQTVSLNGNLASLLTSASIGSNVGGTVSLNSGDLTGNGVFLSALNAGDYILPTTFSGGSILSLSSSAIIPASQVSTSLLSLSQTTPRDFGNENELPPLPLLVTNPIGSFGSLLGGGLNLGDFSGDSSNIFDMNAATTTYRSQSQDETVLSVDSGYIQPVETKALSLPRGDRGGNSSGIVSLDGQSQNRKSQEVEATHSLTLAGSSSNSYSLQVSTFHGSGNGVFESEERP